MVDMDNVVSKLRNGLFVGLGTFGSTFVGDAIDGVVPGGDVGAAAGQLAVGAGISVASDEFISQRSSIPNDVVEYAGYGVQGAAWAEMADVVQGGATSGGIAEVNVHEVSETTSGNQNQSQSQPDEISVDI